MTVDVQNNKVGRAALKRNLVSDLFAGHPLRQHLEMTGEDGGLLAWDGGRDEFMAACCDSGDVINQITWTRTVHAPLYRSGDALNLLGLPDCVQVGEVSYSFFYMSTKLVVTVKRLDKDSLTPHDPITLVIIYGKHVAMSCDKVYADPWHGFSQGINYPVPDGFQ